MLARSDKNFLNVDLMGLIKRKASIFTEFYRLKIQYNGFKHFSKYSTAQINRIASKYASTHHYTSRILMFYVQSAQITEQPIIQICCNTVLYNNYSLLFPFCICSFLGVNNKYFICLYS